MMHADASGAGSSPRPSADEVRRLLAGELSLPARLGYVALLLAGLSVAVVTGSLALGEPGLPGRTTVAFVVLAGMGLSWAGFAARTLTRRRVLLAGHRVVAARMAVAFTTVFTAGAVVVGRTTAADASWRAAAGTGLVMMGAALLMLMRARGRQRALERRRAELERRLDEEAGGAA